MSPETSDCGSCQRLSCELVGLRAKYAETLHRERELEAANQMLRAQIDELRKAASHVDAEKGIPFPPTDPSG